MTAADHPSPIAHADEWATIPVVTVEADIDVHVVERNGLTHRHPIPLPAVLRWRAAAPWAVELDLRPATRRPWVFGWQLLTEAAGLAGRAGSGDVRIRRATPTEHEITLSSRDGSATLRVDAFDLVAFVTAVQPRHRAAAAAVVVPDTAAALLALIDAAKST